MLLWLVTGRGAGREALSFFVADGVHELLHVDLARTPPEAAVGDAGEPMSVFDRGGSDDQPRQRSPPQTDHESASKLT